MLKVVNSKLHHYSKKEKITFRRYNSWAVLEEHNRSKRYKDLGVTEKKGNWLKMEIYRGYDYGSTRPSFKN